MVSGHVFIATSCDGYIARPNGDIDWLFRYDTTSENHGYDDFIAKMDGIIMGRGTYEKVLSFESWPYTKPVFVLSHQLASKPPPETLKNLVSFLDLPPKAVMNHLSAKGLRRVYVDGGQIIQSFLREGLIEDMIITRLPILIGQGRPLFGPLTQDIALEHISTKAFPSGFLQSHYRVKI